jgi:hypothetical protein
MFRYLVVTAIALHGVTLSAAEPTGRYKTIIDRVNVLQSQYPEISEVFSIGTNDDGVDIYAMRVSVNPKAVDPTKIGHIVVSTHHGDESDAPQFTMAFIADLLKRYSSEELWRGKLHDMEFTIIPVLNISGYNRNQREEHGQDPNRDYANPCLSSQGGKLGSIRRLLALYTTRIFTGSVTVHGYDGSLTYPWGMHASSYKTKDHNLYDQIFRKAAEHNGYKVGTAADIVYPANGCYEDFVYWKYGSWSLLLELRDHNSESDIRRTVPAIAAFFDLLDSSPSVSNQFTAQCKRYTGPDLRLE